MTPPVNENQPTLEFLMPMALSMPCTGNGVNTSQCVKPASRIFSAACMVDAVLSNSATNPYGLDRAGRSEPVVVGTAISGVLLFPHRRAGDADRPGASRL